MARSARTVKRKIRRLQALDWKVPKKLLDELDQSTLGATPKGWKLQSYKALNGPSSVGKWAGSGRVLSGSELQARKTELGDTPEKWLAYLGAALRNLSR